MKPPTGILYDLGDTLLGHEAFDRMTGRARILELAHNPNGATLADYSAIADDPAMQGLYDCRDSQHLEMPVIAFSRLVTERLHLTFDLAPHALELEFWKATVRYQIEPGIIETLEALRARGIPLGVVSNSGFTGPTLAWELQSQGLLKYFSFVMSSADYGVRKPHPALYLAAAAKLGAGTSAGDVVWFIGDTLAQDIRGALDVGMTAIWYNPHASDPTEIIPTAQLQRHTQLLDLLDARERSG
jgi:putative hydrolase of the HAD superfamily